MSVTQATASDPTSAGGPQSELAAQLQAVLNLYVDAWRKNDHDAAMAVFTADAVVMPHDGIAPVTGREAARQWWFGGRWPPGGIDGFTFSLLGTDLRGDTAIAWGSRYLDYWQIEDQHKVSYEFQGTVLLVFSRAADSWLISHFMWDDPPPKRQISPMP